MAGRYHGQPTSLCLLKNKPLSFPIPVRRRHTREREDVGPLVLLMNLLFRECPEKRDLVFKAKVLYERLQLISSWPSAHDPVFEREVGSKPRESTNRVLNSFLLNQTANREHSKRTSVFSRTSPVRK